MALDIQYDITLEGPEYAVNINWGHEPGWVERYANALAQCRRITLMPKAGAPVTLPVITVQIDKGKEVIIFSRIFGTMGKPNQARIYAVGWKGGGEKSMLWIYPNGIVEHSAEPSLVSELL